MYHADVGPGGQLAHELGVELVELYRAGAADRELRRGGEPGEPQDGVPWVYPLPGDGLRGLRVAEREQQQDRRHVQRAGQDVYLGHADGLTAAVLQFRN